MECEQDVSGETRESLRNGPRFFADFCCSKVLSYDAIVGMVYPILRTGC